MIWLIAGGCVAALLAMVVILARNAGAASAERDEAKAKVGQAEKANAIDEAVAGLPDDALDRELRGRK